MELLSTTNMLAFNAPDIRTLSPQFSTTSGEESDTLHTAGLSSPPTSVEASPVDSRCGSPEPNHLSTYFQVSRPTSDEPSFSRRESGARRVGALGSPVIPQRAPSHTKAAHKAIARQNSQSSSSSPSSLSLKAPPDSMPSARDSAEGRMAASSGHPFVRELAQLDEVAEGFGLRDEVSAEEEELMRQRGLTKFGVQDYLREIECLYNAVFVAENDQVASVTPAWI